MEDPEPLTITFSRGSAAGVNRRFIGGFFLFAILFAGAAFYRPAIQAFAVGFPIYLVLWKLRLRKATRPGWALVVSTESLLLVAGKRSTVVKRDAADAVRLNRTESAFGSRTELLVVNSTKLPIFRVEIDEIDSEPIRSALAARGWAVS